MRKKKKIAHYAIMALVAAAVFFIGWFVAAVWSGMDDMYDDNVPDSVDRIDSDAVTAEGAFNILLLGTDKGDYRTDTIMLARVDLDQKKIDLLSLMRDTRVKLGTGYNKINAVYGRDKMDGLIKCVKELTGSPIHYYALVNLAGFEAIIDVLGGVEFDVPQDMKYNDPYQNLKIDLKKGEQHLNGNQAMQLVRFRRYVTGDVERTHVQQDFIKAVIEQKLKPEVLLKLPELFREISPYVTTNVTLSDVLAKSSALRLFTAEDSVTIHELPGMGGYVGNVSYFLHEESATYELCKEVFGGTGAPAQRQYTDYGAAAPMNPGGNPPPTTAPPEEETSAPVEEPAQQGEQALQQGSDPAEPSSAGDAVPASANVSEGAPTGSQAERPAPEEESQSSAQPSPSQDQEGELPDNGLF